MSKSRLLSKMKTKSSIYMYSEFDPKPQQKRQCSECKENVNILVTYSADIGGKVSLCMKCYEIVAPFERQKLNPTARFFTKLI